MHVVAEWQLPTWSILIHKLSKIALLKVLARGKTTSWMFLIFSDALSDIIWASLHVSNSWGICHNSSFQSSASGMSKGTSRSWCISTHSFTNVRSFLTQQGYTYGQITDSIPHQLRKPFCFLWGFFGCIVKNLVKHKFGIRRLRETKLNNNGVDEW